MSLAPTSFTFTVADRKLLSSLKERTGVSRIEILRRLMAFYAAGHDVPGLPKVTPEPPRVTK